MKKKMPGFIKDGLTGAGMGAAIIVPGVSAGTIALILGSFNKLTNALSKLFSKDFLKNFLILLPFGIGMVLSIALLYFPFDFATKYCRFALICLFAGLIIGSFQSVVKQRSSNHFNKTDVVLIIIGILFASLIGVSSVVFNFNNTIISLFSNIPIYLYFLIFAIGIIASSGIVVPGLSGSLILLVISFYQPILNLLHFTNGYKDLLLGISFGLGIVVGVVLWGKLMNSVITKHKDGTLSLIIGFVIGSLFSIFFNSNMISYIKNDANLVDWILGPILLILGFVGAFFFSKYSSKFTLEKD